MVGNQKSTLGGTGMAVLLGVILILAGLFGGDVLSGGEQFGFLVIGVSLVGVGILADRR